MEQLKIVKWTTQKIKIRYITEESIYKSYIFNFIVQSVIVFCALTKTIISMRTVVI